MHTNKNIAISLIQYSKLKYEKHIVYGYYNKYSRIISLLLFMTKHLKIAYRRLYNMLNTM